MAKQIKIRQGSMTRTVEVPDSSTVDDIRKKFGERMDLTNEHTAHVSVNGGRPTAVDNSASIEDGATLEFSRTTGQKG